MSLICIDHLNVFLLWVWDNTISKNFFLHKNYTVFFKDLFFKLGITWIKQGVFLLFFLKKIFIYLFMAVLVFVSVWGLSLVVASGGHSSSRCAGLSLWRPLLLRSTGSRRAGSVIVAHGPSCSLACGIFPDQGSNPCPLH